ncbi:hypothetical protein GCM10022255_073110 [Dactylosporangium darangshiense]|uniref:ABC3 transporter permease C-terminal domain-containing protein n=2 Tax=Dactylosporangium darangshiense TaxID=579108 RepID=A0ABP8DJV3_9ACTN
MAQCWSSDPASTGNASERPRLNVLVAVPMLMAAVDPEQEARLSGLDTAVLSGQYLGGQAPPNVLPVLMASRPAIDQGATVSVDRLVGAQADGVAEGVRFDNLIDGYEADPGTNVGTVKVSEEDAYRQILTRLTAEPDLTPQATWGIAGGDRPRAFDDPGGADVPVFWSAGPAGDLGLDDLSKERVRAVADMIRQQTGLRVDVAVGGSAAAVADDLPAGVHGRPAMRVDRLWLQPGVATVVVAAIDRKSLLLAVLVLVTCVLAVANATGAAVRTRQGELGVLACLGWPRRRLFGLVLGESAAVGLAAGVAGTVLASVAALVLSVPLRPWYLLTATPAALVLALLAALVPAWRATRASPAAAIRPAVARVRVRRAPRTIGGLAWTNVLRAPARTALGALSLAFGVAALTLLAVIATGFRGSVTGTLLGDAITVQVRGTDYVAAAITMLLGAATVADVLYVNIRERSAEFALLGAVGWGGSRLVRLAGYEAAILGLAGGLLGAGAGLGIAAAIGGNLPPVGYVVAAAAAGGGVAVAAAAAILPVRLLRRLPTTRLLAEE